MLTQVSIHAFLWLNAAKSWMPTCAGMTNRDCARTVTINDGWY